MNRRDLVKTLALLPASTLISGQVKVCDPGGANCTASTPLIVALQGPFSLVFQRDVASKAKIVGLTVLTPKHPEHLFTLNGVPFPANQSNQFSFVGAGIEKNTTVCTSSDCKDFCTETSDVSCKLTDAFVALQLPCPKRVFTSSLRTVTMGGKQKSMPQDHILEYQIADTSKPLGFVYGGAVISPVFGKYQFEVGRSTVLGDPDGQHAIDFYNNYILPCFPTLNQDPNNQIQSISLDGVRRPDLSPSDRILVKMLTTTLECKSGGLIVGNP